MIINPDNNSTVWYHSTPKDRVSNILKQGLKTFSPGSDISSKRVPWLYLSSKPLISDKAVFSVDISDIKEEEVKEIFGGRVDSCIYQRVFVNIPAEKISLLVETLQR